MDYRQFGINIRRQRRIAGMTIEQLAEKAEISDNFLGKIERGQGVPSLETVIKIADALNCGVDLFLSNELKYVNYYLEKDVSALFNRMDADTRKMFFEFIKMNGDFFLAHIAGNS